MTAAFRFVGVAIGTGGAPGGGTGLALTAAGGLSMVDGDESIRQALLLLLSTTPGERLMRPQYGSYLHRLVFAPNDHTTAGLAIHYVRQAIQRWEPRVGIVDLDAEADPDVPTRLNIRLTYQVLASLAVDTFDYALDLAPQTSGGTP
jgi:uncharacterized protein